jgi:hypothetical protein
MIIKANESNEKMTKEDEFYEKWIADSNCINTESTICDSMDCETCENNAKKQFKQDLSKFFLDTAMECLLKHIDYTDAYSNNEKINFDMWNKMAYIMRRELTSNIQAKAFAISGKKEIGEK